MSAPSPFERFFAARGFVVLDGGLATELEARGHALDTPLWSARLLLDAPDAVRAVHRAYLDAGADCITTASYQASFEGLAAVGVGAADAEALLRRSVELAREACDAFRSSTTAAREGRLPPMVAASAGPYGAYLADGSEYDGHYAIGRSALADFHRRRLHVLADTSADVVAFETIPSIAEAGVIAEVLGEVPERWAWISFTCRDGERLWDGSRVRDAVRVASAAPRLAGVGINCTAPRHVPALVDALRSVSDLPVIVYPNSGETYDARARRWTGEPAGDAWLSAMAEARSRGARVLGGCCRVGPETVGRLCAMLVGRRR